MSLISIIKTSVLGAAAPLLHYHFNACRHKAGQKVTCSLVFRNTPASWSTLTVSRPWCDLLYGANAPLSNGHGPSHCMFTLVAQVQQCLLGNYAHLTGQWRNWVLMAASGDWQPLFSEDITPGLPYWLPVSFPWRRVVVMEVLLSHPTSKPFPFGVPACFARVARGEGPSSALKPSREKDPFLSSLLLYSRRYPKPLWASGRNQEGFCRMLGKKEKSLNRPFCIFSAAEQHLGIAGGFVL